MSFSQKVPQYIAHIILQCDVTNNLWNDIHPILRELHPIDITNEEKAFGITRRRPTIGISLRNWLTNLLRNCISQAEREAYHASKTRVNVEYIKRKLNQALELEIEKKIIRYQNENNVAFFEKNIAYKEILCKKGLDEGYEIRKVFICT